MFSALWNLSIRTRDLVQRHAPTNRLLRWLRSRYPARWPAVVMLYGTGFLAAALLVSLFVQLGLPEPLYLLFFLFLYDGAKFLVTGLKGLVSTRNRGRRTTARAGRPAQR